MGVNKQQETEVKNGVRLRFNWSLFTNWLRKNKKMEEIMTMIENKLLWKSISTLAKNVPKNRSFFTPNANS